MTMAQGGIMSKDGYTLFIGDKNLWFLARPFLLKDTSRHHFPPCGVWNIDSGGCPHAGRNGCAEPLRHRHTRFRFPSAASLLQYICIASRPASRRGRGHERARLRADLFLSVAGRERPQARNCVHVWTRPKNGNFPRGAWLHDRREYNRERTARTG